MANGTRQITATLGELVNAEPALRRVLSVAMDAKTRYHAVKLARLVAQETKHFSEEREAAIKTFGAERPATPEETAKGMSGPVTEVTPDKQAEYFKRLNELSAVPVTIPWSGLTTLMLEPYPAVTGRDCIELGPLYELDPEDEPAAK